MEKTINIKNEYKNTTENNDNNEKNVYKNTKDIVLKENLLENKEQKKEIEKEVVLKKGKKTTSVAKNVEEAEKSVRDISPIIPLSLNEEKNSVTQPVAAMQPTNVTRVRKRNAGMNRYSLFTLIAVAIVVPTIFSFLYFYFWASPMYIAEARFAVRGSDGGTPSGLAALMLPTFSSAGTDVNIVTEYIESPDIMEAVDKEIHIFNHFSSKEYDAISRLCSDATRDDRLDYWHWAVKPSLDPDSGIIALSVKAYEPQMAKSLAEAVLTRSEALVNEMSRRLQNDAITLAKGEVENAEQRVRKAQESMRVFRDRIGILDPATTAGGLQGIVSQLESEIVKVRAEIAEASTYMSNDAPSLVGLRARLGALQKQLSSEKLRIAGDNAIPDSLTSFAGEYEGLQTECEFARQQLVSAMSSLENARIKAEAKSRYVVAFQKPVLPDESLYPRPFLFSFYIFIGCTVLVAIMGLIISAIREHTGF